MAQIIKTDGQIVPVEPKNGTDFQLDELQQIVGGYVQLFPLANEAGEVMVMNEDGKIEGLPMNNKATELAAKRLFQGDYIVGDVLVCKTEQID